MNQQQRLTEYLKKHGTIDPLKAWTQLGIYRLADTVFNLRKKGYDITTSNKKVKNKFKEVCVVAEYKLEGTNNV
jgi:Helix-turn-helix domain